MRISDIKRVSFKAKGMRKPDECIVYPFDAANPDRITFQGERTFGRFNIATGLGVVNYKGSNAKYGMHLSKDLGAVDYTFDKEFVEACKAAQPSTLITLA